MIIQCTYAFPPTTCTSWYTGIEMRSAVAHKAITIENDDADNAPPLLLGGVHQDKVGVFCSTWNAVGSIAHTLPSYIRRTWFMIQGVQPAAYCNNQQLLQQFFKHQSEHPHHEKTYRWRSKLHDSIPSPSRMNKLRVACLCQHTAPQAPDSRWCCLKNASPTKTNGRWWLRKIPHAPASM